MQRGKATREYAKLRKQSSRWPVAVQIAYRHSYKPNGMNDKRLCKILHHTLELKRK